MAVTLKEDASCKGWWNLVVGTTRIRVVPGKGRGKTIIVFDPKRVETKPFTNARKMAGLFG